MEPIFQEGSKYSEKLVPGRTIWGGGVQIKCDTCTWKVNGTEAMPEAGWIPMGYVRLEIAFAAREGHSEVGTGRMLCDC